MELASGPTRRTFRLGERRTSISLHVTEWAMLEETAAKQGKTLKSLLVQLEIDRATASLPSAIRLYLLDYWRDRAKRAGAFEDAGPVVIEPR